ncbi:RNA polymerase sigma-70 factor, ECF subfamily [Filimonas lacunae]|uniref:RNA polymerase sigma-70 factor, ECF subfamily n=1 Tax=Filimonas lacunae TaxID=477680 RepID=A0A173MG25_9BACT|nr:sigma-70 family RNA polymerase sigma factor [Filimonas lacunae]BAV06430.1 RNA polymerase ECF-type sigma factor [Filimonas lacunae]SIT26927.1 RNA polymerase sigma-70 factor, ECF subfamily [Filimonas lacunae]
MTKKEQFAIIYEQHQEKVFRMCKSYFKGEVNTANDTVQEVFIKIWQHLESFRNESRISTWIYRITVNCCLLHKRKSAVKKEIPMQELPDEIQLDYNPIEEEQLKKMYTCIGQLEATDRLIITMILEGMDYGEITDIIGITGDTLRVRIHRIKKKLTNCVQL